MSIRVIQWATGTVGIHAVPAIVAHPKLELAGLWVHSDSKAGQDAGTLTGGEPVGITATQDGDALLALDADCICYTASSDIRPDGVIDDICRFLASGKNVVNTSFVPLLFPAAAGEGVLDRLEAACREGGTSFYTSGIDPGFGNAGLAIHALALCKEVRQVRMMEIINYDTWDNPFTMFEIMGFGKKTVAESLLLSPGSTTLAWGPVLHLVAAAIGLELDEIVERHEIITAPEDFDIASGTIPAGTISGMRFEIVGVSDGEERLVIEHVTRLRDEDAPEWPPSGPRGPATGSSSPANRTSSSSSASRPTSATTTTPVASPPPSTSSTPSPTSWRPAPASRPSSTSRCTAPPFEGRAR
ncbi:MAG: putative Dihydrodipicolinate reductase [Acidimicrobiales bacterium]|nr:putative Dihydrodipicolinate reductase [Acidimicrobiales bacterium]